MMSHTASPHIPVGDSREPRQSQIHFPVTHELRRPGPAEAESSKAPITPPYFSPSWVSLKSGEPIEKQRRPAPSNPHTDRARAKTLPSVGVLNSNKGLLAQTPKAREAGLPSFEGTERGSE